MAGCFLLVFIVFSVSIIVPTVNNNIYNYSYKYKKKHKLLNQISNWKKKKKKFVPPKIDVPNTSTDLLRDIILLLLFTWNKRKKTTNSVLLRTTNSVPLRPKFEVPNRKKKKKKHRSRPTNQVLVSTWKTKKKTTTNSNLLLNPIKNNRKKKKQKRPTNLLLLLLFIMTTTYTVAANDLEGVIIRFAPHPITAFPFLHHTLNGVYGVDLYETDFLFLF